MYVVRYQEKKRPKKRICVEWEVTRFESSCPAFITAFRESIVSIAPAPTMSRTTLLTSALLAGAHAISCDTPVYVSIESLR